jgi:putative transposase
MGMPRQVLPRRFIMVTRRCVQRQFLLRPDDQTNNNFLYALGLAAQRFGVTVLATCVMSNHHHTVIYDEHGMLPDFMHDLHLLTAKSQNCLRGRWEHFWASGGPSAVELIERNDVLRAIVYALSNPVKDLLVDTVAHWPGVNSWAALRNKRVLHATRPKMFTSETMPESIELEVQVPAAAGLGSPDEFVAAVARGLAQVESDCAAQRRATGRCVIGRSAIRRQSPLATPSSSAPRRQMSPRVKASNKWHRIEALTRNRAFVEAHRIARLLWRAHIAYEFPVGTWALRHLVAPDARPPPVDRALEFEAFDL